MRPLIPVAVLAALPALLAAQQSADPPPQAIFRADVASVDVDVVVTDSKGRFVKDLTADDFEIEEDDVPQEISTFSFVDLPAAADPEDGLPPPSEETGEGRQFVMILNGYGPRLARVAWQFLDEAFGPADRMAVYHNHPISEAFVEGQAFTGFKPALRQAIRTVQPAFRPFPPLDTVMRMRAQDQRLRRELEKFEMLERAVELLAPTPGRRKAVLWIGGNLPFQWSPGRSSSGGVQLALAYREVIRAAARHNVVIYPIDPEGLGRRGLTGQAGLRALAEDTGVEAIVNTNDFGKGFARIVRDMSTYYLLGYVPRVVHRDGRFHGIRVRVRRPDVSVRARKGYFADEPTVERAPSIEAPAPVQTALADLAVAARDEERRRGVPGDSEERRPGVPGDSEERRPGVPGDSARHAPRDAVWFKAGSRPVDAYVRVTVPQFSRTERMRVELPAAPGVPPGVRLLDRLGSPLPVPLRVSERTGSADDTRWIVVDLTLAPMARGEYVIEVSEGESARALAFRVVP